MDIYVVDFNYHATGEPAGKKHTLCVDAMLVPDSKQIIVDEPIFHIGDIARIKDEFMLVESIQGSVITVRRGLYETEPGSYYSQDGPVYIWNLSNESNISAIAKQGLGVQKSIEKVKELTNSKKVILVCHSMGGVAAREYIRTYNNKDIAKIVTIGTPHYGSNLAAFPNAPEDKVVFLDELLKLNLDVKSDAQRDLKTGGNDILNQSIFGKLGLFLFGDNESENLSSSHFYSKDIDADGTEDDQIIGLSRPESVKSLENIFRTWIVSTYIDKNWPFNVYDNDLVVLSQHQYISSEDTLMTHLFHLDEPKDTYTLIRGLDEPDDRDPSFAYEISSKSVNKGYITYQKRINMDYKIDLDLYKISLDKQGTLSVNLSANEKSESANLKFWMINL